MTNPKPVVTMDKYGSIYLGSVCVGQHSYGYRVEFARYYAELNAAELRAIADFLDQLEEDDDA